jgi:hypothetical protein
MSNSTSVLTPQVRRLFDHCNDLPRDNTTNEVPGCTINQFVYNTSNVEIALAFRRLTTQTYPHLHREPPIHAINQTMDAVLRERFENDQLSVSINEKKRQNETLRDDISQLRSIRERLARNHAGTSSTSEAHGTNTTG